jgi:phosphonate transport system permease protein
VKRPKKSRSDSQDRRPAPPPGRPGRVLRLSIARVRGLSATSLAIGAAGVAGGVLALLLDVWPTPWMDWSVLLASVALIVAAPSLWRKRRWGWTLATLGLLAMLPLTLILAVMNHASWLAGSLLTLYLLTGIIQRRGDVFAFGDSPADRLVALGPRIASFLLDWASWGYLAYAVMYLLNSYWYLRYINFYGRLTLPPWGWPVVILATLELTLLSRALGQTLGMSLFGLRVLGVDLRTPSLRQRLRRLLSVHLFAVLQPWVLISEHRRSGLLHDGQTTGTLYTVEKIKNDIPPRRPERVWLTYRGLFLTALLGITFWLGWKITTINLGMLVDRIGKSGHIWRELFTPNFEYLTTHVNERGKLFSITYHMMETVFMAFFATVTGALVAFPLSFLGARNIMGFNKLGWLVFSIMRFVFNAIRSIESILMAVLFAVWVGFGNPFAGSLALFVHTIAALGKLYSEQVEAIDPGPLEAIAATGARRWQIVIYGVIPQIIPSYLAFTLYRWDINIRMATIIALVGGGGIGTLLFYFKNEVGRLPDAWNHVGAIIFTIVIVVWMLDYISARVREKIG